MATLGPYLDLSTVLLDERVGRTLEAIANKVPVIYQPAFVVRHMIAGTEVEIVGAPDFLILDGDGYLIRDCKMSRRIEAEIHPEIIVQVQLYGWLFERSTGFPAKELQVYNGMKEIVAVEDDGGEWALRVASGTSTARQRSTADTRRCASLRTSIGINLDMPPPPEPMLGKLPLRAKLLHQHPVRVLAGNV